MQGAEAGRHDYEEVAGHDRVGVIVKERQLTLVWISRIRYRGLWQARPPHRFRLPAPEETESFTAPIAFAGAGSPLPTRPESAPTRPGHLRAEALGVKLSQATESVFAIRENDCPTAKRAISPCAFGLSGKPPTAAPAATAWSDAASACVATSVKVSGRPALDRRMSRWSLAALRERFWCCWGDWTT